MPSMRSRLFILATCIAACSGSPPSSVNAPPAPCAATPPSATGVVTHVWVHGKGLEGNRLGDSPDRSVHVYLPPSYFAHPERRYPTVYFLHGYGGIDAHDGDASWMAPGPDRGGPSLADAMDAGIAAGRLREMIVVMPECQNAYGGCFYTNSSVAGAWGDYFARELVAYVDAHYRTVNAAASRGLVGHSMGGFGALRLAFAHPDVFSVAYAIAPCCIDDLLMSNMKPQDVVAAGAAKNTEELSHLKFFQEVAVAAGAAFTPDPAAAPLFAGLPFVAGPSGPQPVEAVQRAWSNMLATSSIAAQKESIARLRAIGLAVGSHDEIPALLRTTHALDRALTAAGIAHEFHEFDGGHADRVAEQVDKAALPFVSGHVVGDGA